MQRTDYSAAAQASAGQSRFRMGTKIFDGVEALFGVANQDVVAVNLKAFAFSGINGRCLANEPIVTSVQTDFLHRGAMLALDATEFRYG